MMIYLLWLFFVLFMSGYQTHAASLFQNFLGDKKESSSDAAKAVKPFFNALDGKKNELQLIIDDVELFRKRAEDVRKATSDVLTQISYELTQAKDDLDKNEPQKLEYINKKITILNDRKQNLTNYLELFKVIEDVYNLRVTKIKDHIEFLQNSHIDRLKPLYSWEEFREAQREISDTTKLVDEMKGKKDALIKQELAEKEGIVLLQKQLDVKTKERDKNIADNKVGDKAEDSSMTLKMATDLFNQDIDLIKEKIVTAQLKLEHFGVESKLREDDSDFMSQKLTQLKSNLAIMEKRLSIEQQDVELARSEAIAERQKTLLIKEEFNKKIEEKTAERSKLEIRKDLIINQRKKIEVRDKHADNAEFRVVKSEEQKIVYAFKNVDLMIKLLAIKNDRADTDADDKDLLYQMVELRFKLTQSRVDLETFIAKFKSLRDLVLTALRKLNLDRQEVMNALVEDTKELEIINLRREEINSLKDFIFKTNNLAFQVVIKNLDVIERHIHEHMKTSHELLVSISELIASKEKIINKYNLIIQDLDNQILSQGIWKRSPRAISWEAFLASLAEAENFLITMFWDTPKHLGPVALINAVTHLSWVVLFQVLLSILMFFGLFYGLRGLLNVLLQQTRQRLVIDHKQFRFLWLNIIAAILEFLKEHIVFLVVLIYGYVHIAAKFKYIFSTISFLGYPYYIALFHLASMVIFVYLSQDFLMVVKDLNRRLSFLFFAEKLQERFILLITSFCYSTATIIPFRMAFLSYPEHHYGTFADVLLTAYSLILIIILLLFFSKDDVLRLVPSGGRVMSLVKFAIERHYYPVFFFFMGLLIISNPYIGYSNLAWFLAFAVPSTVFLFYAMLTIHYYIRKYSIFFFMKEEDDEIVDKFEYAKTYYGLLVIFSFLFLFFGVLSLAAHLWRFGYTPVGIWKLFSDSWVIRLGDNNKFGLIELLIVSLFITGGFFVSSFMQRFILSKLFDILRTEPGMQNTISKIAHYMTISMSLLFGLTSVHLHQLLMYVGAVSAVAIGFVLKDVAADYVAGLFILIERPLEIGNYVRLEMDDIRAGTVHKIDARTTTIINKFNHALIIPNKDITNKIVANWGKGRFAVGFEIMIDVDYHSDVTLVKESIIEVVQSNPTILRVPRIVVRMENINETKVTFLARVFISSRRVREQWDIAADLRENIFKTFNEKGIRFAYPQHVVHAARDVYGSPTLGEQEPISFKF